jgi:hypothetical protein
MFATATGKHHGRLRQGAMRGYQLGKSDVTAMPGVNVEHNEPR